MIVVKVELHSAITHEITELARMVVCNDGTGSQSRGNYKVHIGRKGSDNLQTLQKPQRTGRVEGYPRISASVWALVARALSSVGFK